MPIRRNNTRHFIPKLYGGITEKIRLLKRGNDQKQGTVIALILFNCRRQQIMKTGEILQGDMTSDHTTTWVIPVSELKRVGVNYLSPLDRLEQLQGDEKGNVWQPEADTTIDIKLFGNVVNVACKRADFPKGA